MSEHVPSFGELLRAYRLGYGWSGKYQCYVRISGGPPLIQIDVRPGGLMPSPKTPKGAKHRVWWDHHELLDMIEDMPHGPRHAETFTVDDNGRRLRGSR